MTSMKIGIAGLGVMGENLALNFAGRRIPAALWNRTPERVRRTVSEHPAEAPFLRGCGTPEEFAAALERPRRILLMVSAGQAVDDCIARLLPHLETGDILMDGGNSRFQDSLRRAQELAAHGVRFLGIGISGGSEGARLGPSLMAGGDAAAWRETAPLLNAAAARAGDGTPCCALFGNAGAGHFVKMIHNGIEYAEMQLLAEGYAFLRDALGRSAPECAAVFRRWNAGMLRSFLAEISAAVLDTRDPADNAPLIDRILDAPGWKGTGRWTSECAVELDEPVPTLTAALFQREIDAAKSLREAGAGYFPPPPRPVPDPRHPLEDDLEQALFGAKIAAYAQGFALLGRAGDAIGCAVDRSAAARVWRAGCILRSPLLDDIAEAFDRRETEESLLFAPVFRERLTRVLPAWRRCAAAGIAAGLPIPCLAGSLAWFDACRTGRSAANLIQAQRDCFGAHTYERTDAPRGAFFHTRWNIPSTQEKTFL